MTRAPHRRACRAGGHRVEYASMMLDVQELTRRFGRDTALDGVTFSADAGERIAVVGRNGAGKTTLLRVLSTFLPADSGRASVAGFDLFSRGGAVRSVVGYLPEGAPLDPDLRVAEYLRFRGHLRRMSGRHLRRRLHDVAAFCGLAPILNARIRALSAGQRHAVGLADAILHEPDVLLFDDPLAAADAVQARSFARLLAAPEVSDGRLVLFSTHDAGLVRAAATRVLFLERGRLAADTTNIPLAGSLADWFDRWSAQ